MKRVDDKMVWLEQEDYEKAVGQLRIAIGGVLNTFNMYGMSVYFLGAQTELVNLAEDFGQRIRGVDKPISLEYVRRNNGRSKSDMD